MFDHCKEEALCAVIHTNHHLTTLKCSGNVISDATLHAMANSHCSATLTSIDISENVDVTNDGVCALVTACGSTLISLNLYKCESLTDETISSIAAHCVQIKELDLSGCKNIGSFVFQDVVTHCKNMKKLVLKEKDHVRESFQSMYFQMTITAMKSKLRPLTAYG